VFVTAYIECYKVNRFFLKATGSEVKEGKRSPCIIVQGGGYSAKISEHHLAKEYEQVTKNSAKEGYTILMVSVR
jgi:hypothetical protein